MAQKHDGHAAAHPSVPSSPPVTPSDKLLSSLISLPPNPRVAYVTFVPTADGPPYDLLEFGRRQLLSRNDSLTLMESILPYAHIDGTSSALHAFMFTSHDHSDASLSTLRAISLDGLAGKCSPDPSRLSSVLSCIRTLPCFVTHSSPSVRYFTLRSPRYISLFIRMRSPAISLLPLP